jgi:enoyl-CoA hydratase/carnithine racemase
LFCGEHISAREAEAMGMINHVIAPEELQKAVRIMAEKLVKQPTTIIGWTKWALNKGLSANLQDAVDYEVLASALNHSSKFLPSAVQREEGKTYSEKKQDA